ncbi:mitochondrial 50S ribosomal protein L22 [Lentinula guzmanii]|uniref:Mitochondrial 50S ribosomal protein L22 n=1 Tax=Lentinula guzmanii TaxID=2804957 RepID=A0AA38JQL8_9AGAR|nr:mitochondrial 50S ribosomal protein L22 [Lentinula guzmanii]
MQRGLHKATRSIYSVHPTLKHSLVQTRNASTYNPLNWLRQKLTADRREKESKKEILAAKEEAREEGQLSLFEQTKSIVPATEDSAAQLSVPSPKVKKSGTSRKAPPTSHKYSTTYFKMSPRKLNMLGNQISGKPIDYAILQMQFSEKRASKRIMNMLATAKDHACRYKHLDMSKLVVGEAWVNKGKVIKRIEPRGRGHMGIRKHKQAKMHVVLKEGMSIEEKKEKERAYKLKKIVSAATVRENRPIRNPGSMWAW